MVLTIPPIDLGSISPLIVLLVGALVVLMWDAFSRQKSSTILACISLITLALSLVFGLVSLPPEGGSARVVFGGMYLVDSFGFFFNFVFILGSFLAVLISVSYGEREGLTYGEYYCLILFATMGMILMAGGNNLLTIFLGVEVISISLYVLAGFLKTRARSNEAAVKYFLLGAFATGFLLYGIALIYGATGTTDLTRISAFALKGAAQGNILLLAGMALLIVGLGFKLAAVPFHMWTPDVYEGAPTSVTAFMSAGPKAAVFAAFFRIFAAALPQLKPDWTALLWVIAVLTMTLGNVVALAQFNIKRMLAYSSIAHAGYLLIAVVVGDRLASSGLLFYLLAYTLMNLGAFGVVAALETREGGALDLRDYRGLGYKYPGLAFAMGVFMFSLSGIPPTAGFVGKFYIFSAAVNSGFIWLAVIGVLNSVVSVYFYLRVVVYMYMLEPTRELAAPPLSIYTVIALILTVLGTLGLGVFPSLFMELAQRSIIAFT